ncbi:DNA cytosine methyltransferase [Aphanothece sacrum]|uniref:Cytosine-specific methyltransferase n=1 Tax=Aphanothece sacrum FPU1 TaxID=1920663 RepID=A0A401IBJ2_APHSA|nr:DNA cytosine methyltransferase [Aphanothece sacrum]GBF78648.1 cytosine-specific methyltransferase [Aphanothece sacrum FPU1]GBF84937.1 cytosine-specific methyltransferase [Aphanothece sacrum FPU3]
MKVIDLFAGCGGLSLGFQNAGYSILAAYDNWEASVNVYRQNFNHPIYNWNLNQYLLYLEHFKNLNPDMIIGGPPCQDFSSAGKRDENLGRGDLTIAFVKIISEVLPKIFVLENVERFNQTHKYLQAKAILKKAEYGITEIILDASLCGVPQKIKRFFWIGIYQGKDNELNLYLKKNLSQKSMTIRDYLGDKFGIDYYYRHPRSYKRRAIFSIDEPSPTIRGVNRPIPKTYQSHLGDATLLSSKIRPLTTQERSYLQTFPDNFIWEGSKTNLEQMIGNAVPVKLAEYVANCILEYLNTHDKDDVNFFVSSQYNLEKKIQQLSLPL